MAEKYPTWTRKRVGRNRVHWVAYDDRAGAEDRTIVDQGSGLIFQGGTLDPVAYDGTMDLSPGSSSVTIVGGLTMHGVNGTGVGTMPIFWPEAARSRPIVSATATRSL